MSDIIPIRKLTRPQDLVLRFLSSVGHKHDADFYLDFFTSLKPESFAIIVIDQDIASDELESVLFEIRYLMRLSLFPVILIQTDKSTVTRFQDDPLARKSGWSTGILSDDFSFEEKIDLIRERIKKRALPLIRLDPATDSTETVLSYAKTLGTARVIWLRRQGGIAPKNSESALSIINLRFEKEKIIADENFLTEDKALINFADATIKCCPHRITISIASPRDLLRELFTVKGAGTLLQKGSLIFEKNSMADVDADSLKNLLEISFERSLRDDFFNESFDKIYLEENYMGAALTKNFGDSCYVSKFAVGTEARGLGVGKDLWVKMTSDHKKIFWRSHPSKFINQWYIKQCDGFQRTPDWIIFWKGVEPKDISQIIDYSLKQPQDFLG